MFMRKVLLLTVLAVSCPTMAADNSPNLGKPAPKNVEARWNLDVFPDGSGLPLGSGTAVQGKKVYQQHCLRCHGVEGTGDSAEELAGAKHGLTDTAPDKTIGTYWPYATTIFDFTRRAMPLDAPGVLSNDQLYAVVAYLLHLNHLIKDTDLMNASTLPKLKMPNREGFINSYHPPN